MAAFHVSDEVGPDVWTWFQAWYAVQCDGDWEHQYGVSIESIDNPGWMVRIDLKDAAADAARTYERREIHRADSDWLVTWVVGDTFQGACGPTNLGEVIDEFRRVVGAT